MENLTAEIRLVAKDDISAPIAKIEAIFDRLEKTINGLAKSFDKFAGFGVSLDKLGGAIERLNNNLSNTARVAGTAGRAVGGDMEAGANQGIEALDRMQAKLRSISAPDIIRAVNLANSPMSPIDGGPKDERFNSSAYGRNVAHGVRHLGEATEAGVGRAFGVAMAGFSLMEPVKSAMEFDNTIRHIAITLDQTGLAGDRLVEKMGKQIDKLARATGQTGEKLADAAGFFSREGYSLDKIGVVLPTVAKISTAYNADPKAVAQTAFTLQESLGIKNDGLSAALAAVARAGKTADLPLEQLAPLFPAVAAQAGALGVKGRSGVNDLAALLAIVRKTVGNETDATVDTRSFMQAITSPHTAKRFENFGVDLFATIDAARKTHADPMLAVLDKIDAITKTGSNLKAVGELFNNEQDRAFVNAIMSDRLDPEKQLFAKIQAKLSQATPKTVDQDFTEGMKSLKIEVQSFSEALEQLERRLGEAFAPVLATITPGLHALTRAFDWLDKHIPGSTSVILGSVGSMLALAAAIGLIGVDPALLDGYDQGSTTLTVGYSGFGGIDTIGLLQSLETGGWGSSEDLAAQAWPLIHFREPGLMGGLPIPGGALGRLQEATDALQDREDAAGRIGQWHLNDGATLPWTQIYLVDFLTRARDAGLRVDPAALGRALDWLDESQVQGGVGQSDDDAVTPRSRAYALFVLARAGRLNAPAIRSMHDDLVGKSTDGHTLFLWGSAGAEATKAEPLALGHMAAALELDDQHDAGRAAFGMAVDNLGPARVGRPDLFDLAYWIYVRDLAGVTALAADAHDDGLAQDLVDRFDLMTLSPTMLNDQEKAGLLDVASSMTRDDPGRRITVNGKPIATPVHLPVSFSPTVAELRQGYVVANAGTTPMWLTTTVTGTPTKPPPATDAGYSVAVQAQTLDGKPFDTRHLRQNDRFVLVISGQADGDDMHHTILVDRLPAGWEIESTIAPNQDAYSFLGEITAARSVQAQDDRYFAVFDTDPSKTRDQSDQTALKPNQFRLAYVVRAVTPGHFVRPETVATDQYRPTVMGRTAAATTDIDAR